MKTLTFNLLNDKENIIFLVKKMMDILGEDDATYKENDGYPRWRWCNIFGLYSARTFLKNEEAAYHCHC